MGIKQILIQTTDNKMINIFLNNISTISGVGSYRYKVRMNNGDEFEIDDKIYEKIIFATLEENN